MNHQKLKHFKARGYGGYRKLFSLHYREMLGGALKQQILKANLTESSCLFQSDTKNEDLELSRFYCLGPENIIYIYMGATKKTPFL